MPDVKIFSAIVCSMLFLAACSTQKDSGNDEFKIMETYSLERNKNGEWQIHHDSEYYDYFNRIHRTYNLLLKEEKDADAIRRLFIERDLKIAQKRLGYMADAALVKKVVGATAIRLGTNPTGHLFRMNDVQHVPRQSFTPPDPANYVYKEIEPRFATKGTDAITAIIQFDRQLKKRGIKLIVVPVPNSTQLYTHQLTDGIRLEEVVWHPWAHMIVKLLEYDVEVLDLLDLYKTYSGANTTLNYIDHHWGQAGLDIVSTEIAQRLKRFHFDSKYYLDPAGFTVKPVVVATPALIPHWDHIDITFISSRMDYNPMYERNQILYNNQTINPAATFEDSPVLIMGDSFIPHAAETSSGIYAHLAYYTGIRPAAYSRDAGAAKPPATYMRYVAGKGNEPEVVIWEIYGSAFNQITDQNDWMVVKMPDPESVPADSGMQKSVHAVTVRSDGGCDILPGRDISWIAGEVEQVSELPPIKGLDYPDALYAFRLRVTESGSATMETGKTVVVYSQFLKDFSLNKENVRKKGDRSFFYLEEWISASRMTDKIGTMQVVDDLEDYESDIYYSHFQKTVPDTKLTRLKKTSMQNDSAAAESFTFRLEGIRLVDSMKLMLRHKEGAPVSFSVETSINGRDWFSIYTCQSNGFGDEVKILTLDSVHPAQYVRLSGDDVLSDILFDDSLSTADDFCGIDFYGY